MCSQSHVKVGGFGEPHPANDEVKALFETADTQLAVGAQLGYDVHALEVISFTTQVVRANTSGAVV